MGGTERAAAQPRTAVTNVRVFDGRQLLPLGTVVIEGDRIGFDARGAKIVGGDPLQDVKATRAIRRIWCGGAEVAPL